MFVEDENSTQGHQPHHPDVDYEGKESSPHHSGLKLVSTVDSMSEFQPVEPFSHLPIISCAFTDACQGNRSQVITTHRVNRRTLPPVNPGTK